jgi:ethanolamine utilization protein EutN
MQRAVVLGHAVAIVKHASLGGQKLLVVQPQMADGRTPDGDPLLAIDTLGAGKGESVIITSDGRFAREIVGSDNSPVRWSVMGICDE